MNAKSAQKVQMPLGIRKKMMASVSMLLVAAIMMVSSSYAWFTLSTAPEITGISTSVGANGNLEIALLNTETFNDTTKITSNTGDAISVKGKVDGNITWGNLIDLADDAYGLEKITLYPSALHLTTEGKLDSAPLSTPGYGADGRVAELVSETTTAIYNETTGEFDFPEKDTDYGVRSVGTSSSVTGRQITFRTAKTAYTSKVSNIANPTRVAVANNYVRLLTLAMNNSGETATTDEVKAMQAIAVGVQNSLKNVVSAYANAALATAAATASVTDEQVTAIDSISNITSASELKTKLNNVSITEFDAALEALATQQTNVDNAVRYANEQIATESAEGYQLTDIKTNLAKPLLGEGTTGIKAYDGEGKETALSGNVTALLGSVKEVYIKGGAIGAVAAYSGPFKIANVMGEADVWAGVKNGTSSMTTVTVAVEALTAPTGTGEPKLTDHYGYIIDFAFRTNAAESNLLLQTEAMDRVYQNEENLSGATQGSGSTAIFTYGDGLTSEQGKRLLQAIRVVFFNAADNTILGIGAFADEDIDVGATSATGKLTLHTMNAATTTYTAGVLGKDAYATTETTMYTLADDKKASGYDVTITADAYNDLPENNGTETDANEIQSKDDYQTLQVHMLNDTVTVDGHTISLANGGYTAYVATSVYENLTDTTTYTTTTTPGSLTQKTGDDAGVLSALTQNQVLKMSALVYMDGENIDNSAVGNAASSGTLDLNLQFSSSASLVPMQNNALKNMTTDDTPAQGGEVTP